MEEEGVTEAESPRIDVFFAVEPDVPREAVAGWLAQLRAAGVSCDTDYAGRSLKGQLTQAARLGAESTVVVGRDHVTLRRSGADDEAIGHDEVVERLSA
jgi:histidyl-tRNA synthetase